MTTLRHGHSKRGQKTRVYVSWRGMMRRCYSQNHKSYQAYAGRGIKVCERWRYSFDDFLADMGEPPPGLTLERIDNDGNYEPSNCKWATRAERSRNRSCSVVIEHHGRRQCLRTWAIELGFSENAVRYRRQRGWPIDLPLRK